MMKKSRTERFTARKIGRAINRYGMIRQGDKVLVGVSGGKDSLALLRLLHIRKRWIPVDYKLKAVHVATDYDSGGQEKEKILRGYFNELGCDYEFLRIEIKKQNKRGREDCFWCSWNRRKALFQAAENYGCSKLALGHHKDDIAETILMNLIYNGEVSAINPVQELFGGLVTIIRPLVFLEEREIRRYVEDVDIREIASTCPLNSFSKRACIKKVIRELSSQPGADIKKNIINAPLNVKREYITPINETVTWWERFRGKINARDSDNFLW